MSIKSLELQTPKLIPFGYRTKIHIYWVLSIIMIFADRLIGN
jgi:hypothetical protein